VFDASVIPTMASQPDVEAEKIKDQARKDLLDLLEGVCKTSDIAKT
jgi:hypothetical protein